MKVKELIEELSSLSEEHKEFNLKICFSRQVYIHDKDEPENFEDYIMSFCFDPTICIDTSYKEVSLENDDYILSYSRQQGEDNA